MLVKARFKEAKLKDLDKSSIRDNNPKWTNTFRSNILDKHSAKNGEDTLQHSRDNDPRLVCLKRYLLDGDLPEDEQEAKETVCSVFSSKS